MQILPVEVVVLEVKHRPALDLLAMVVVAIVEEDTGQVVMGTVSLAMLEMLLMVWVDMSLLEVVPHVVESIEVLAEQQPIELADSLAAPVELAVPAVGLAIVRIVDIGAGFVLA